jgi:hypothetical protein
VLHLADLEPAEAADLGPVLASVARAVTLASSETDDPAEQVYACLWSHAGRAPGHIHFVVQPVGTAMMGRHDAHGPELQVRMFRANEQMDLAAMAGAAERIGTYLRRDEPARRGDT